MLSSNCSISRTMLNKAFKTFYLKIHLSKYFERLQCIKELYRASDEIEYFQEMEALYSDLLRFPLLYFQVPSNIQSNNEFIQFYSIVPNDPIASLYSSHTDLLLKTDHLIINRNASELYCASDDIGAFLDKLYDTIFPQKRTSKKVKYALFIIGLIVLAYLTVIFSSPFKERYLEEKQLYDVKINEEVYKQKTIVDVLALKEALQKYYNDNRSYPKSSGGFDAILVSDGQSKEDWIPGLAPRYIKSLPIDPRKSKDSGEQYMYKSDGRDFKLIAHNPLGINEVVSNHPELVDPVRPSWAFGAWSEGGKNW